MEHTERNHLGAARREEERVTPLELFFDLVFVLAITQCTTLMSNSPTWEGLAQGLLVLAVLWWSWGGYAWLTSVVDPRRARSGSRSSRRWPRCSSRRSRAGRVRRRRARLRVRLRDRRGRAHRLFTDREPRRPELRRSVTGSRRARRSASRCSRRVRDGRWLQRPLGVAIALDWGCRSSSGRRAGSSMPAHFAERHGLIVIIALGESIVAIGVGANAVVDVGVVVAATLGIAIAAALWWLYFDVIVWLARARLSEASPARSRTSSRATPTRTCTSRWSRASCCSRSA
jgi:hypothetical protein